MAKIRITESELKQVIRESVESILNEEILNEKFLRVDLRNMPTPQTPTNSYNNLMANPSDSPNAMNMIKADNRNELYQKLENLGFSKEQIVQGLNAGAAGVYRTRLNGTEKDLTNTNRGQRKINRARVYSGKHGGPEASEVTAQQIQYLQGQVQAKQSEIDSNQNIINQLSGQVIDLQAKLAKANNSLAAAKRTNTELTKANQTLTAQNSTLNQRVQNNKNSLAQVSAPTNIAAKAAPQATATQQVAKPGATKA